MNADSGSDAPFPFAGDNLLLLMGLPAGSRVLAIGDNLDSWRKLFRNCSASAQLPDHHSSTCGLILYHSTSAATRLAFAADMRRAREILADNGSILVFAENPASWRNLGRLKQEAFGALLSKLRDGHTRYEQELQRAGFGNVRRFHPLPGLGQPEELVAVGSSLLELPHYWHPVLHMANKLGVFRMLAEGFVIHAGLFQLDSGGVVGSINDEISRKCGRQRVRCMLERIDIRYRGALVLFWLTKPPVVVS